MNGIASSDQVIEPEIVLSKVDDMLLPGRSSDDACTCNVADIEIIEEGEDLENSLQLMYMRAIHC